MNVYAIIVGVEHYDALLDGIDIELDGPASDAVRFARWLLERGVPPVNLCLFLSPLDTNAQRAELNKSPRGGDVPFLDATRDRIEAFFNNELRTFARTPGILYMLWGGHGVVREGREQHLFYSNFRKGSPFTFHVEDRLSQLLAIGNLSPQHIFIDACANYVELTQFGAVDSARPVIASPDPTVRQNLIRSAASGQKARNNRIEKTGDFSNTLFTLLNGYRTDDWPTAEYLAPLLEQAFIEKARQNTSFRQRPVSLRFRSYDGSRFDLGSQPTPDRLQDLAIAAECSISQLNTIGRTLSKSEKLDDVAVRDELYRRIVGTPQDNRSWREDREFDLAGLAAWTLHREKTKDLAKALDRIGDSAFGVVEAVMDRVDLARQAIRLLDPFRLSTQQYLEAYLAVSSITLSGKRLDFFEDMVTQLAECDELDRSPLFSFLLNLSTVVHAGQREAIEDFLLERANPNYITNLREKLGKNRTYRVLVTMRQSPMTVWGQLIENGAPVGDKVSRTLEDPPSFLARLQEVYSELLGSRRGNFIIELILPFEYLCENLESTGIAPRLPVPIAPTPLCHNFPFMLRWRERIVRPTEYNAEKWKRAVQYIRQRMQPGSKATFYTPPFDAADSFWSKLDQPDGDLFDLGREGSAPTMKILVAALYNGTAFACWPRKDLCENSAQYKKFKDQLLEGDFADIPRRAVKIRRDLDAGASIALFWDDPDTDPTPYIKSFEEMKETN